MRRLLALLLVFASAFLAAAAPGQAEPSRFTVEYCDPALPAGNPPAWSLAAASGDSYAAFQTCAAPGGALGIVQSAAITSAAGRIDVAVSATPGGFVESETISALASGLRPGEEQSYVYSEGWPLDNGGDTSRFFRIRSEPGPLDNGGSFAIVLSCTTSHCVHPSGTIAAHDIAATEVDPVPPTVRKVEGSLLAGGVVRGHQALTANASDVGGGVSRMEPLVNGLPAAPPTLGACGVLRVANASYEGLAAISPTPCPAGLAGSWLLDTGAYPFQDGTNSVQVCASDLATTGSPDTTCSPPQTVTVDNSCADSAVAGGQALSAGFAQSSSEAVTVPYGQPAELTGELADTAGDAISGATICIQAQTEGIAGEPAPVATVTTDAQGQFSYELPGGPNRRLLVGYRHDSFQVGRRVDYFAHAKPTLRLRPSRIREGDRIRITGALPGPSAAGRVVVLQASALHGRRWLTFRRATTGPRGRFASTYRFGRAAGGITYRIRAVAPRQSGYPYEPGHSEPARVKVRAE